MSKKQLINRIIQIIIVLFGISLITFTLIYLAPGDPVRTMYAASGMIPSEDVIQQIRESMGLNDPFFVQYWNWLSSCLRGDFGISYSTKKPVIVMLIIAVPFGILAAVKKNKVIDFLIRGTTFLGLSIPNFWVGLMLLYFIALKFKLLPVVSTGDGIEKMILPVLTLAFSMAAKYTRQVRTVVLEELNQDYVIGARARGIKENIILLRHVLPNSLLPLITLLGLSLGSLLGGTAVVEVIFSYPGLGNMAVSAITSYDYPLIQAYVMWIALIYMIINLLIDISYKYLDPRVKERG